MIASLIGMFLLLINSIEVFVWPQMLQRSIMARGSASGHTLEGYLKQPISP